MARKVFVSSDISFDESLLEVAAEEPMAALLWPWFLTRFDDWGRALAHPLRIKAEAFAMNAAVTVDLIGRAIDLYDKYQLVTVYHAGETRYMAVDEEKWKKYQTHIRWDRKRTDADSQHPAPPGTIPDNPGTNQEEPEPSNNVEQHNTPESRQSPGTIPADAGHDPGYSTLPPSPPPSTHTPTTSGSPPRPEWLLKVWAEITRTNPTMTWIHRRRSAAVEFLRQHPDLDSDEAGRFVRFAAKAGCAEPGGWASWWPLWNAKKPPPGRPDCARCENSGLVGELDDGTEVARHDMAAVHVVPCPGCNEAMKRTPAAGNVLELLDEIGRPMDGETA